MPTFWYRLRRCGILKICGSKSKVERPLVPKKPGARAPGLACRVDACGSRCR